MQAEPTTSGGGGTRRRWRRLVAGGLLAVVAGVAALAAAFLWGVAIPGEFLRAPLERALTSAFGMPTRLEGPLQVRTGRVASASADALVIADPSGPPGAQFARAVRPAVKIDLVALARRVVALDEVSGERLELALARASGGRGNWAPIFERGPGDAPPAVSFGGISWLQVGTVVGTFRDDGAAPVRFEVAALDGALPASDPVTARGTLTIAEQRVAFDLRTASLDGLGGGAPVPVQGSLDWSGARAAVDGKVAADGSRFDASVRLSAADATPLLAALGVATHEPGPLDASGRLGVTATQASASDLAVALGPSAVSGRASVDWQSSRLRVAIDLAGERVHLGPFLAAAPTGDGSGAEPLVRALDAVAAGVDADLRIAVREAMNLPLTPHEVKLEALSADRIVSVRGDAVIAGTPVKGTLEYDARKDLRTLVTRVEGKAISTARLPQGERPPALSGTTGSIRGELRGQGTDPKAIVASLAGSLAAADLRWSHVGGNGRPLSGRFDTVRVTVQGTRASSARVAGKLGDTACTLTVSGGGLAPLLEGERWPLTLAGSCGAGGRLQAKGPIALAKRHLAADLTFDARTDRIGPIAQALGLAPDAPHPFGARGALALDEKIARVRLDALRLGRSAGKGEVEVPLAERGVPRVQLALTNADVDELAALAPASGAPVSSDPMARAILPANLRLPELEFDVAADTLRLAGETLRRAKAKGALRDGRLPRTPFAFDWGGAPVSGEVTADFRGAQPNVDLRATAGNADLGPLAARAGLGAGSSLRVGRLALNASGAGVLLRELVESARGEATIEQARFERREPFAPGLPGRAELAATLKVAPGQPAVLASSGTLGGQPLELHLETPGLGTLARADPPVPATLRMKLGDASLQASGRVARDGTGDGRVELRGTRLDRLGALAGIALPEVGPYEGAGTVAVSADSIRASGVEIALGKSRLLGSGEIQVRRGGRPLHTLALRAPTLHLEDFGGARWIGGPDAPPFALREEALMARAIELLRAADVNARLEVDALHGGGAPFASGALRATLAAGDLRVTAQNVRTEGGTIDADFRVDASGAQPKLALRARIDGVEFGPLARTIDPATRLGGRMNIVADLTAQGPPAALLPALAGSVDWAVFPHDLSAQAIEFWGTGLLSAMLRSVDPAARSEVDCAVASLDVAAGVARSDAFLIETTRVRIIGQVDADLATRALSGRLRPVSRQPTLFTVAPTMVLGGTIESPQVSVAPENLVLAPLRFATPLGSYALDWLGALERGQSAPGGCREAFDRARQGRVGAR